MKFEIETYKGQTIEYDDENDKFICDMNIEERYKNTKRSSLKDLRKEIDTFVKLNLEFKPFKAFFKDKYSGKSFQEYTVEAIRTDGKFVISGGYSKSYYDEEEMKNCMIFEQSIKEEQEAIEAEKNKVYEEAKNKMNELFNRLVPADLSKYDSLTKKNKIE